MKWIRLLRGMMALLLLTSMLAACGQKAAVQDPEPVPIEEPELQSEPEPEPIYAHRYPFNGMGTDDSPDARPVIVTTENQAQARPQSGLHKADVVYEVLAEGEITRFIAVYQSEFPELVGPVRSIRSYMVEIGEGLDALIVHAGWSQEAMNMLAFRNLPHFDGVYASGQYFWRDNTRRMPHNLYTSLVDIREAAEKRGYRTEWSNPEIAFLDVKEEELQGEWWPGAGQAANKVMINYIAGYKVEYEFDPTTRKYLRTMAGEPHVDRETNERLTADNILIIKASHRIIDNVGRRDIDVHGPGEGYIVQNGKVQPIEWKSEKGFIRAYGADGQQIPLLPGQTWIQIIPTSNDATFE